MQTIIEITSLPNGAHRNQTYIFNTIPDGYAIIPNTLETPNFPFGIITTELINGVPTVTSWTPTEMPKPIEPERTFTQEERLTALENALDEMLMGD